MKISIPMLAFLVVAQLIVAYIGFQVVRIASIAYRFHGFQWLTVVFALLASVGAVGLFYGVWYFFRLMRWGRKPVLEFTDDHLTYTMDYKNIMMVNYADVVKFDVQAEPTTRGTKAYFLITKCDGNNAKIFTNLLDSTCSEILTQSQRTLDDYHKNKLKIGAELRS